MDEINDTYYTIVNWDDSIIDTLDVNEAKLALREGREVVKNTRKTFYSGLSHIRLYVSTEMRKAKDL